MSRQGRVGVVVVGDELLSGRRQDRHLAHVIEVLHPRGMQVAWCRTVGDDLKSLTRTLRETQLDTLPVFCFGGIGATPDDRTRQAAACAFGAGLIRHHGAVKEIEARFGAAAYPARIRMADLPEGSLLIPNPYNRIPGFTLYEHHFFPGFPEMAWPMLDWVLDACYPMAQGALAESALRVHGVAESELVELMEMLGQRHPDTGLFSLPHLGEDRWIELGFRGQAAAVDTALADLAAALDARALDYEAVQAQGFRTSAV